MKATLISFAFIIILSACSEKPVIDLTAGNLRLAIDKTGKIIALEDVTSGTNYIASGESSYLVECLKYDADSLKTMMHPSSMTIIKESNADIEAELLYEEGIKITLNITPKEGYFRMELREIEPVSKVSQIVWGPYKTIMRGQIGEWLGLNRSNDFTIGLLSLEPNTDGILNEAASYTAYGSKVFLTSYDHTRGRFVKHFLERRPDLRKAVPLPGVTPVGSAVALFGSSSGKSNELKVIKNIVTAEGLPQPEIDGVWNKHSDVGKKFCIWAYYTEENFEDYLKLSNEMGARILCRPGGFSGNWGHFEINPRIYPGGIPSIMEHSKQAKKKGIGLTLYTLTTFLKPNPDPEPYLTPVPDERLQEWKPKTRLNRKLDKNDKEIFLEKTDDVLAVLNDARFKVIRIGDELIALEKYTVKENHIVATDCERGAFHTIIADHPGNSEVRLMFVAGYRNFYPGTLDLSNEFSERLGDILLESDLDLFVVDGFESCLETGYGSYTGNIFLKNFYDKCVQNNKEVLVTTSMMSQYAWHIFSHISWGEGDQERGVRGSMLDYRLARQLELSRNLMPNKLGQYYPSIATAEDINWIMALATGWDAGVDFQLNVKTVMENPEYKKIIEILELWEEARADKAFSEEQKMELRQTDVLYKLSKNNYGEWDLTFDRFWQNEKIQILPPSVMAAKPVSDGTESVRPLSIDWSWTHNPGLYDEVGLSDDLIHSGGTRETLWTVDYPPYIERPESWYPTSDRHFQFFIRLPEDAPGAVRNFKVTVNEELVEIPATLQPGQYLTIPHLLEMVCIYNSDHKIDGEVFLHGYLPKVKKGATATVGLSCEPVDKNVKPEVIMNVRFQNGYYYHR